MISHICLILAFASQCDGALNGAAPSDELTLFKLPKETLGGRCNDGSPAAWYYGSPANESVTDWVIWLEGGGACSTAQKCSHRKHVITSSDGLLPTFATGSKAKIKPHGKPSSPSKWILSDDPQGNPDFFHAHHVYVHYCSSDEFAGTRTTASAETFGLYFSGHLHLVNIFGELKKEYPTVFGSASRVLFAGSSAGGIGTIHNIDWVRDFFPSSTVVKGAPLGGWFVPGDAPDQPNAAFPPSQWPDWSMGKVTPWGVAGGEYDVWSPYHNPGCAQAFPPNGSSCISASAAYQYIKTPMYIMENNYDANQLASFGFPSTTHSEMAQNYMRYYGRAMRNSTAQVNLKPADGLFLSSCFDHTAGLGVGSDFHTRINGKDPGALLGEWFYDRLPASDRIVVDDCGELPCNPTCTDWPGPAPGPAPAGGCTSELKKDCPKASFPTLKSCSQCAGKHEADLEKAKCTREIVETYCKQGKFKNMNVDYLLGRTDSIV